MKRILAFVLLMVPVAAQTPVQTVSPCIQQGCYLAPASGSLAAGASVSVTVQQPATGARSITFQAAVLQCPGQPFTVDQAQNGTAATTTAGTITPLIPTTLAARATFFTASNAGAGTATAPTLSYVSGAIATIGLSDRVISISGTVNNYTFKITNTGTAACTWSAGIYFIERI